MGRRRDEIIKEYSQIDPDLTNGISGFTACRQYHVIGSLSEDQNPDHRWLKYCILIQTVNSQVVSADQHLT